MKWFPPSLTQCVRSFMALAEGVIMSATEIPIMRENSGISVNFLFNQRMLNLLNLLFSIPSENYENM